MWSERGSELAIEEVEEAPVEGRALDPVDPVKVDRGRKASKRESARAKARRPGIRASLACEGLTLTQDEEALLDRMDDEGLSFDECDALARDFVLKRYATDA